VRALEEITLRVEGAEEKHPYPGLASYTEADAEYFFGREAEVESLVRKLGRPRLLAIVGPSGAGKSSFLRAGLVPALPEGWSHVTCQPGDNPFSALADALVPALAGDAEGTRQLLRFGDDAEAAVAAIGRWRKGHEQALLTLDQFEELFTQNPPEVQARFAELLGRLPIDANVHVLLSMRDDFLFHCHEHLALSPLLSELTLLGPPRGAALRRALVQPALTCGYRFEDEALVDEMLGEVAEERGALPLLAFAAARLLERRDRETETLTREAYEQIDGVAGALAQHAEATLERIGTAREELVRELFRNLVTSQGTRAVQDRDELLSEFEDRESADKVLQALIDAVADVVRGGGRGGIEARSACGDHPRVAAVGVAASRALAHPGRRRGATAGPGAPGCAAVGAARPPLGHAVDGAVGQGVRSVAGALRRRPDGERGGASGGALRPRDRAVGPSPPERLRSAGSATPDRRRQPGGVRPDW